MMPSAEPEATQLASTFPSNPISTTRQQVVVHHFRIEFEPRKQIFQPTAPPLPPSIVNQQDGSSTMFTATSAFAGDALYGAEVNNGNVLGNLFMHMDHCLESDNHWPPY
ncbi:hypothetical protein U1Q18_047904 [Sarracenia purpurea var. burkii]